MEVVIKAWGGESYTEEEFARSLADILAPVLQARGFEKIVLIDSGDFHLPMPNSRQSKDKVFRVLIGSHPGLNPQYIGSLDSLWGQSLNLYFDFFQSSGKGIDIVEPGSDMTVAEIIDDTLYIPFWVSDPSLIGSGGVFRNIVTQTAEILEPRYPLEGLSEKPNSSIRFRFDPAVLTTRRQGLRGALSNVAGLKERMRVLEGINESDHLLEVLARIPEIKSLSLQDNGVLKVYTHTIYCKHSQKQVYYELGKFEITFPFGRAQHPTFRNLTRQIGSYHHPNINDNGWCAGEGEAIVPLIRDCEIQGAVLLALAVLQSVGDHHGGNYLRILEQFPLAGRGRLVYPPQVRILDRDKATFARWFGAIEKDPTGEPLEAQLLRANTKAASAKVALARASRKFYIRDTAQHAGQTNKAQFVQEETQRRIQAVANLPTVAKASITNDTLVVVTQDIVAYDRQSGESFQIGALTLTFDTASGSVTAKSANPIRLSNNQIFHAPHAQGRQGVIEHDGLSEALPELLGKVDLEAAVSMTLAVLEDFDRADVPPEVLAQWKQVA